MGLSKPYYRIIRPFSDGDYFGGGSDEFYCESKEYAPDRAPLIRAYHIIEKSLIDLFAYVDPADENLKTYSHKLYELLLRASTEFETNCKAILKANGYTPSQDLNIRDYYKINRGTRLSEYQVVLERWLPRGKVFEPFKDWNSGHSLGWYQAYNDVKHDRNKEFPKANLENVLQAVTALFAILFSQFYVFVFNPYQKVGPYIIDKDGAISVDTSIIRVIPPSNWSPEERYDFNWDAIKSTSQPLDHFRF